MSGDGGRHLTLVVPGLLGPLPSHGAPTLEVARVLSEGLELPALERFISRSTASPCPSREPGLAALLFDCFCVAKQGSDWPVAAVTRRLDGAREDGRWWLRADPVHLRASMGDLTLVDSSDLRVAMDEAEALTAEINTQLGEPALCLQALTPDRWYLGLDEAPRLVTEAPWEASGSPVSEHLPWGDDARHWQARINDVQMILHASPVNHERERRGESAINSVWLWGGGRTPRVPGVAWQGIWSDNPVVAGLGGLAEVASHALPADAGTWLTLAQTPGHHLLVASAAYVPVRCSDVDAWRSIVSAIEERWIAPLLDAMKSGHVQSVRLRGVPGHDFCLRRGQLGHWWRRISPFARIMTERR